MDSRRYRPVNTAEESWVSDKAGPAAEHGDWLEFAMNSSYGKVEAAAADPFYKVRDNVNAQVERIKVKHDKFQDLLHNGDGVLGLGSADLREQRKVLLKEIKSAEKDIRGLQVAIDMIEKNR